ncbi:hypothetical protein G6F68_016481 [Rhizopus microsporus]|nr:hypothetical protein G6F68_016481 [Rhizopus microsporus]
MQQDEEINKLHQDMTEAIRQLNEFISSKKNEVYDQDDLSGFNKLVESFEVEISLLNAAIDNASPRNVNMTSDKNIKSNLQALLRSLIASYKLHQPNIMHILEQARVESKKQSSDDHSRAEKWLAIGAKKWASVKAAAAAPCCFPASSCPTTSTFACNSQ